jgi:hypothetical protein
MLHRTMMAAMAGVLAAIPAASEPTSPLGVFIGTSLYQFVENPDVFECGVESSPVLFQAGKTNKQKTFSSVYQIYDLFWNGANYQLRKAIYGTFTLSFSSVHAGILQNLISPNIITNEPGTYTIQKIPFFGYSESFNPQASALIVQFTVDFPDCTVPFVAIVRGG